MNYDKLKQRAERHAQKVKELRDIRTIYHSNDKEKKPWTFSKKLTAFIICNCTLIELYALVVMFVFRDLSALPALITAVVGECICMCGYLVKSTFENTANGITYETAMADIKNKFHSDEEAAG